ncbi:MAG: peptide chain release factor 2 [Chloroflexota bacterium]|nr:peptide chain release factor 2 [Chloroflexota bacterium]
MSPAGSTRPRGDFDLDGKTERLSGLDDQAARPELWDDPQGAQRILREAEALRSELAEWRDVQRRADDLVELADLAADDPALTADIDVEYGALSADFDRLRTALLFSGEYDARPAIVSISAGAGGTEATDWAEMLLRMYLRWSESHRFATEILDQLEGEGAGLKSATIAVDGHNAYGYLRAERGVHRLVRISPYDSQKRRHTTFALVEVLPEADDAPEVGDIPDDDLKVDTFRAQGAGGQHVNKTDSAVRITHLPTGLIAQSQNERSQHQNREVAMKVLKARLLERLLAEREQERNELRGAHVEAGWGNQIRSYVLHPYQMVKDHRNEHETSDTSAVLDGALDGFMLAELERVATEYVEPAPQAI